MVITIDRDKCNSCGNCVNICPFGIVRFVEGSEIPTEVGLENCMACGQCAASCPTGALSHSAFPAGTINRTEKGNLPSLEQVMELLRDRRSVRAFKDKAIERPVIEKVLQMASYAPTAHNVRSVEFVVTQDRKRIAEISKYTAETLQKNLGYMDKAIPRLIMKRKMKDQYNWALDMRSAFELVVAEWKRGHDVVLHDAPAIIAFVSDPKKTYCDVNAQLAIQNAFLSCEALGLGSFYCGFASSMAKWDERIAKTLEVPPGRTINGIIAIGYPKVAMNNYPEREVKATWV